MAQARENLCIKSRAGTDHRALNGIRAAELKRMAILVGDEAAGLAHNDVAAGHVPVVLRRKNYCRIELAGSHRRHSIGDRAAGFDMHRGPRLERRYRPVWMCKQILLTDNPAPFQLAA